MKLFIAMVLVLGLVRFVNGDMCGWVDSLSSEYCEGCPGFTVCACFAGACPSQNVVCNSRPKFCPGGIYVVEVVGSAVCQWVYSCAPRALGPCDPLQNPCQLGSGGAAGKMLIFVEGTLPCEYKEGGPR